MSSFDDKLLDPRECRFRLNAKIRGIIDRNLKKSIKKKDSVDPDVKTKLESLMKKEESDKEQLSYDALTELHKLLQRMDNSYSLHFYQLMDECKMIVPEGRKNKELEDRLRQLKFEQSKSQYQAMTSGFNMKSSEIKALKDEVSDVKPVLITLLNCLLVIGGTFAFFYKAVEYALPQPDVAAQVLVAIIASTVVAIAELYFFVKIM